MPRAQSAHVEAASAPEAKGEEEDPCGRALRLWLGARGVEGTHRVRVARVPGTTERRLEAAQALPRGSDVLVVPLDLCVCDWPDDPSVPPELQGAPGSVRLAVKLLKLLEQSEGAGQAGGQASGQGAGEGGGLVAAEAAPRGDGGSGCEPFLRSLPASPPALLLADPDLYDSLQYTPLQRALVSYRALAREHYARLHGAGLLGGAPLERFLWALAVVGSRCLGSNMLLLALLQGGEGDAGGAGGAGYGAGTEDTGTGAGPPAAVVAAAASGRSQAPPAAAGAASASAAGRGPDLDPDPDALATAKATAEGDDDDGFGDAASATLLLTLMQLAAAPAGASAASAASVSGPAAAAGTPSPAPSSTGAGTPASTSAAASAAAPRLAAAAAAGVPPAASPGGDLRMLVPLVDMMNHAGPSRSCAFHRGDRNGSGGGAPAAANARWELRPPAAHGGGDGWRLAVVTVTDVAAGDELFLCYDERGSNDAFALHYGFVPDLNPNDDVILYDSMYDMLAWHREEYGSVYGEAGYDSAAVDKLYREAAEATKTAAEAAGAAMEDPVRLRTGGSLCPRLAAALARLPPITLEPSAAATSACAAATAAPVARRCKQLLRGWTPLLPDLQALAGEDVEALAAAEADPAAGAPSPAARSSGLLTRSAPGRGGGQEEEEELPGPAGPTPSTARKQQAAETEVAPGAGRSGRELLGGGGVWLALVGGFRAAVAGAADPELEALAGLQGAGGAVGARGGGGGGGGGCGGVAWGARAAAGAGLPGEGGGAGDGAGEASDGSGAQQAEGQGRRVGSCAVDSGKGERRGDGGSGSGRGLEGFQQLALSYRAWKKVIVWEYLLGELESELRTIS
ncbi:hypothetical protein HYH03_011701 [Edaphochlamys debaryana]|uniref:SET domain-containing protein n=1 Tax=Edaphochlamys debaryana TaxID=47281 RepID=A0A835XUB6_9CHLO|nr:hypothetical protein HYH03_011701 [Edaphochlamys debaryana]|eukprot:KAG2489899.1 hypothetical protein HYH03_011701 [Edaphochlamys debaryana]